jgi:sirohydrochlorin cobaltochelatase
VSSLAPESALGEWLAAGLQCIGQIAIESRENGSFALRHRDDAERSDLILHPDPEDALVLARFDDEQNYRPLKTAPNLRHGWQLVAQDLSGLRLALDFFYPGRLAALIAFEKQNLGTTPLRQTLERQSGMYRIAAQIDDDEADALVGNFCRSDGGCLRTILWRRNAEGAMASTRLPVEKFEPKYDQTGRGAPVIPLLCQEACNLLVAEARKTVQAGK